MTYISLPTVPSTGLIITVTFHKFLKQGITGTMSNSLAI